MIDLSAIRARAEAAIKQLAQRVIDQHLAVVDNAVRHLVERNGGVRGFQLETDMARRGEVIMRTSLVPDDGGAALYVVETCIERGQKVDNYVTRGFVPLPEGPK